MLAAGVRNALCVGEDAMATEFGFAVYSKSSLEPIGQLFVEQEWYAVRVVLKLR